MAYRTKSFFFFFNSFISDHVATISNHSTDCTNIQEPTQVPNCPFRGHFWKKVNKWLRTMSTKLLATNLFFFSGNSLDKNFRIVPPKGFLVCCQSRGREGAQIFKIPFTHKMILVPPLSPSTVCNYKQSDSCTHATNSISLYNMYDKSGGQESHIWVMPRDWTKGLEVRTHRMNRLSSLSKCQQPFFTIL